MSLSSSVLKNDINCNYANHRTLKKKLKGTLIKMVISSTGFSFVDNAMLYSATDSSKIIVPAALSGV